MSQEIGRRRGKRRTRRRSSRFKAEEFILLSIHLVGSDITNLSLGVGGGSFIK